MFRKILSMMAAASLLASASCNKTDDAPSDSPVVNGKVAPDGFNYNTSRNVSIDLRLLAGSNEPISGVPVSLFSNHSNTGVPVFTGLSDAQGYVRGQIALASYTDTLIIHPSFAGLAQGLKGYITANRLQAVIGGQNGFSGNIAPLSTETSSRPYPYISSRTAAKTKYTYVGTYNGNGYPNYLVNPSDVISAAFLNRINASFPERVDMRTGNPAFLSSNATSTINLTAQSDVWITFVAEGASYLNSLGYFTYPTNQVPADVDDIDTIKLVLPNASLNGSGGDMKPGDKIRLGRFNAGTSIGFVLLSDAWDGKTDKVKTNAEHFFTLPHLNPENTAALRKHSVLLFDQPSGNFITGFEDINRNQASCDHDFNDLLFYTRTTNVSDVNPAGIPTTVTPGDDDGDGVANTEDDYPTDPVRAYDVYYPSEWGTIAYEDLWPSTGDYDMNDLLLNYRYKFALNAASNIVDMEGRFAVGASGASFSNGFAVELPVPSAAVASVSGAKISGNYISFNSNGTEAGQPNAVIVPFDNHRNLVKDPSGGVFINTQMDRPKFVSDTATLKIRFTSPQNPNAFLTAGMDHFLISNQRRGYEIHLPGYSPTVKADASLFGQWMDNTLLSANRSYLSKVNTPWAIGFLQPFKYPQETMNIADAYTKYMSWVQSGGTQFTDWYSNTAASYRNNNLIYTK